MFSKPRLASVHALDSSPLRLRSLQERWMMTCWLSSSRQQSERLGRDLREATRVVGDAESVREAAAGQFARQRDRARRPLWRQRPAIGDQLDHARERVGIARTSRRLRTAAGLLAVVVAPWSAQDSHLV